MDVKEFMDQSFQLINPTEPILTAQETDAAYQQLSILNYRQIKRHLCDKLYHGEPKYVLFSFVEKIPPCPEKKKECTCCQLKAGQIHGAAIVRGAFKNEKSAAERAKKIMMESDSCHSILTCKMGVPFPIVSKGYANEVNYVHATENTFKDARVAQKLKEQKENREIEQRLADIHQSPTIEPIDEYITHRVKVSQIEDHLIHLTNQMLELHHSLINSLTQIKQTDELYYDSYPDQFLKTQQQVGIPQNQSIVLLEKMHFNASDKLKKAMKFMGLTPVD